MLVPGFGMADTECKNDGIVSKEAGMITPVLLCGGSGARLWPLSRKSYPKQFARILEQQSLFQASTRRLSGPDCAAPVVVTNSDFRFIVREQLDAIGIEPQITLIEPEGRNTAPAILAAALRVAESDPEAIMLVAPSDHVIPDAGAFRETMEAGAKAARTGRLVTFGITPERPETGYGWLELADAPNGAADARDLVRFVEKPDQEAAQAMLDEGRFLWNAGIFMFQAKSILEAFEAHAPEMLEPVREAVSRGQCDMGFLWLDAEPWSKVKDISIDYAVMERAENLSAVPFSSRWADLGDWQAVWREMPRDLNGVAASGNTLALDCHDSLRRSETDGLELVGIGLDGIVAVAMPDAVLVADAARGQEVRAAVTALKRKGAKQATAFSRDHRPWGWFETLAMGDRFQVKRIVVHPGGALSLQCHQHRAEHWIVVQGTARVTIGDESRLVSENQSVYVPLGTKHRLENPGKEPMVLIEVQTGSYLGEDDIIRYEDAYARN